MQSIAFIFALLIVEWTVHDWQEAIILIVLKNLVAASAHHPVTGVYLKCVRSFLCYNMLELLFVHGPVHREVER